jgi:hypothetical protein
MTEQDRFETYANTQGYSIEKDDQGLYRSVETFCHWGTWQAAIESQWQPIGTAPKDGTVIFGFWEYDTAELHNKYSMLMWMDSAWVDPNGIYEYTAPSSWMPLPQPPKE